MLKAKDYRNRYYAASYASQVMIDGTPILHSMIKERLPAKGIVLDVGAGPGGLQHPCRRLGITLVGIDISETVSRNKALDSYLIRNAETLPFEAATVDAVFSDFTFEHLKAPQRVLSEIARVLKPGGSLVFRTVNLVHYVAICALLLDGKWRSAALTLCGRSADEAFPTYYRFNTRRRISRLLQQNALNLDKLVLVEGPPDYLTFSSLLYKLGVCYERFANASEKMTFLRANILVAARKCHE